MANTPPPQDKPAAEADDAERASGSVENPIQPGEPQPGDANELASNLGGPIDVFPAGGRRKPPQQGD